MRFNCIFLFSNVFRLDRQINGAVLAIHINNLGFNFSTNLQLVASIFHFIARDLRAFKCGFDVVAQVDNGAFGINFFNGAFNNRALVVLGYVVVKRIVGKLLDAQ